MNKRKEVYEKLEEIYGESLREMPKDSFYCASCITVLTNWEDGFVHTCVPIGE